jgi:hypothetical protein
MLGLVFVQNTIYTRIAIRITRDSLELTGVSVIVDELSQGLCPLRGMVNLSVVVTPALFFLQLKGLSRTPYIYVPSSVTVAEGLALVDESVHESWAHSCHFAVDELQPSLTIAPPTASTADCSTGGSVTIVTASILIESNRHDFTKGLRYILKLGCPTVVFGDESAARAVDLHKLENPTQSVAFIPVSSDDLRAWHHFSALEKRATPEFCNLINWTSQHSLYLAIVLMKPLWLLQVAAHNEFDTEHVLWLDASPRCLGLLLPPLRLDHPQIKQGVGLVLQSKWVNPNDLKVICQDFKRLRPLRCCTSRTADAFKMLHLSQTHTNLSLAERRSNAGNNTRSKALGWSIAGI